MANSYSYRSNKNELTKDTVNKAVSGVCAGIARRYKLPRWAVRLLTVVLFLNFPVAMIIAYIAGAFLLPSRSY